MDAYQQAVEYLTANPGKIDGAWSHPREAIGGCLFKFARPDGVPGCACLTMIRGGDEAWTNDATMAIRMDKRLPSKPLNFPSWVDALPVFAQWQRWLDIRYNRTPHPIDTRIPAPTQEVEFALPEGVGV